RLVVDLVGEAAPAPRVVGEPLAPALLDQLARAREDLVVALLRGLRIEHQQNLVVVHRSLVLPSLGLRRPRLVAAPSGTPVPDRARSPRKSSIRRQMRRFAAGLGFAMGL